MRGKQGASSVASTSRILCSSADNELRLAYLFLNRGAGRQIVMSDNRKLIVIAGCVEHSIDFLLNLFDLSYRSDRTAANSFNTSLADAPGMSGLKPKGLGLFSAAIAKSSGVRPRRSSAFTSAPR